MFLMQVLHIATNTLNARKGIKTIAIRALDPLCCGWPTNTLNARKGIKTPVVSVP